MFHLPGYRAALGSMGWLVAILLTATSTSRMHRMGTVRVSLPLVKFRRGEARWHGNPPEAVRQLVSTGLLIAKNNLAARQEPITPRHRTRMPKIDLFPNSRRY